MGDFRTSCPHCGAAEEDACLEVIYVDAVLSGVYLNEDGFALSDCNSMETNNEIVVCHACHKNFPLSDCMNEG